MMLILSEAQVRKCLTMERCIAASRIALSAIRRTTITTRTRSVDNKRHGIAVVPKRIVLPPHHPQAQAQVKEEQQVETETETERTKAAPDLTLFKPAAFYKYTPTPNHDCPSSSIMGMKIVSIRSNNPFSLHCTFIVPSLYSPRVIMRVP